MTELRRRIIVVFMAIFTVALGPWLASPWKEARAAPPKPVNKPSGKMPNKSSANAPPKVVSKAPLPRSASIRASVVNVHVGPGMQYPVCWVLVRERLPVRIVAEFDVWRKIEAPLGTEGWVHRVMLSEERTFLVTKRQVLYAGPDEGARALAELAEGVILGHVCPKEKCCSQEKWHCVSAKGVKGFVPVEACWGHVTSKSVTQETGGAPGGGWSAGGKPLLR